MNIDQVWPDFENLVYYDGPVLIISCTTPNYYFIATAIAVENDDYLMFGVDIFESNWKRFSRNQIDLRELFVTGEHPRIVDMVTLMETQISVMTGSGYLPEPGFWYTALGREVETT
jgi:hypothetical protein